MVRTKAIKFSDQENHLLDEYLRAGDVFKEHNRDAKKHLLESIADKCSSIGVAKRSAMQVLQRMRDIRKAEQRRRRATEMSNRIMAIVATTTVDKPIIDMTATNESVNLIDQSIMVDQTAKESAVENATIFVDDHDDEYVEQQQLADNIINTDKCKEKSATICCQQKLIKSGLGIKNSQLTINKINRQSNKCEQSHALIADDNKWNALMDAKLTNAMLKSALLKVQLYNASRHLTTEEYDMAMQIDL